MSILCPYCRSPLNPRGLKPGQFKPKCPKCEKVFVMVVPADPNGTVSVKTIPEPKPAPAATGDFTEAIRGPEGTGDFSEPPRSPQATGDFTDVVPPRATGDFSAPSPRGPQATGDFTEAIRGPEATGDFSAPPARGPDATGDFTEPIPEPKGKKKKKKASADELDIPDRLGGYEVLKVLGKGGMGAVLLGRQVSLDRKVALKIMHERLAKNPSFVARFTREAYAAAQLTHHNVIQVYDIGEEAGTHFFSMEFVNGQSLQELVRKEGKLDAELAVGYVLQAARGLRYGHNQGMVHRDIKPDNLMLNAEGIVKVADLGLVKLPSSNLSKPPDQTDPDTSEYSLPDDGDETQLTRAGAVMGTAAYMPPEQATDSGKVDHRADIYSLGCTLYVLVTGKPPFDGKTALEVISKHQTEPIVPPEVIVKRVPKALSGILLKMLAKKPEDRYQTMDEVIAALEGFLGLNSAGPFNPSEEQADALEKAAAAYNAASKGGVKKLAGLAFLAVGLLGLIGSGLAGRYTLAGGFLGLLVLAPLAYFVVRGVMTGGYVFRKARELVLGAKLTDWLMWAGGLLLALATLYIFGLLWWWLGFCVLAVGLAYGLWFVTDKAEAWSRVGPTEASRQLLKKMRLNGQDEESVRQFVCKYSGADWEPLFEELFGYEAKLAARKYRSGATGEPSRTHAAYREPVVAWIDARIQARKEATERKHLQKVQAKALEAQGVSAAEARKEAATVADSLVGQATELRATRLAGRPADVRGMVAVSRAKRGAPLPGHNIAGVPLKDVGLKYTLNAWVGRRCRFLVGAAVFAVGLLWLNMNKDVLKGTVAKMEQAAASVQAGDLQAAGQAASDAGKAANKGAAGLKPLPFLPEPMCHYGLPLSGLMLMLTGVFYFGWRPTIPALLGTAAAVGGPLLGVPDAGPVKAWMISTAVGAVLILGVGRMVRD